MELRLIDDLAIEAAKFVTPVILISRSRLLHDLESFTKHTNIRNHEIYFPVKTNNDPEVLKLLKDEGVAFEVASLGEQRMLEQLEILPSRIIFSNPIKLPSHIEQAFLFGIKTFAFDTESELHKISLHAPGSNVYLRLNVPNGGAEWKLDGKFGADEVDVLILMKLALHLNLRPVGLAFHVGWCNPDTKSWNDAMLMTLRAVQACKIENINLEFVNLGGGFPAHRIDQYKAIGEISKVITPTMELLRNSGVAVLAEPGSFISANAGVLVTTVIEIVTRRDGKHWLFVDTGIMQGMPWRLDGMKYDVQLVRKASTAASSLSIISSLTTQATTAPLPTADVTTEATTLSDTRMYNVTGPTCDSHDLFAVDLALPADLAIGDLLLFRPGGAYVSSAQCYNGFAFPASHMI